MAPDISVGEAFPLVWGIPNVMAYVRHGNRCKDAMGFWALSSTGRALKIVYVGRSQATKDGP